MIRRNRLGALALTAALGLGAGLWLLAAALPGYSLAQPDATAATSSPTPSPAVFTATLDIIPDRQQVWLGQTLLVTLTLTVSEGCHYPVYEATLSQNGHNTPHFRYVDPPTATVGPGVVMPFTYTLEAISAGYVTLDGELFGEQNCGNGWQWTYVNGTSPSIKVADWPYRQHLPLVAARR